MVIEEAHLFSPDQLPAEEVKHRLQEEGQEHLTPWEEVNLKGERFLLKRDRLFPTEQDGIKTVFHIDEYHHPETGTQIQVWNVGLDKPKNEPAVVRADYGCPCMVLGASFKIPGHDCAAQREMMNQTIQNVGIGAMAVVSEQTAAGNGHGSHAVFDQSTTQHLARERGDNPPSMQEFYSEQGYFPFDKRRHDLVGLALAHTIGEERPVLSAMSSGKKNQQLSEAGLNIIPQVRVELHTDPQGLHAQSLRRDGYGQRLTHQTPGPYLSASDTEGVTRSIPLTEDTYNILFRTPAIRRIATRRLPN